jgi:HEAT repeats
MRTLVQGTRCMLTAAVIMAGAFGSGCGPRVPPEHREVGRVVKHVRGTDNPIKPGSADYKKGVAMLGGADKAIPILVGYVKLPKEQAPHQDVAVRMLGLCGKRAVPELLQVARAGVYEISAEKALGEVGKPAVDPLLAALKDKSEDVRKSSAVALGYIGDSRAMGPLVNRLRDTEESVLVRFVASRALGKLGKPAVKPLLKLLKNSKEPYVRSQATQALGLTGAPEAVEILEKLLSDKDKDVVRQARHALEVLDRHPRRLGR